MIKTYDLPHGYQIILGDIGAMLMYEGEKVGFFYTQEAATEFVLRMNLEENKE